MTFIDVTKQNGVGSGGPALPENVWGEQCFAIDHIDSGTESI